MVSAIRSASIAARMIEGVVELGPDIEDLAAGAWILGAGDVFITSGGKQALTGL